MTELAGRTVLLTGAASGLGRALAVRLGALGATLALIDRDGAGAARTLEESGAGGVALEADLAHPGATEAAAVEAWAALDGIDILVNNAGISGSGPPKPLGETGLDEWEAVMAVNVTAPFLLARAVVPRMAQRGRGVVVNVASLAAFVALAGRGPYVASKSALVGLTRVLAAEYAAHGVRVNALCPGWIDTPFIGARLAEPGRRAAAEAMVPLGRVATADEIADAALFLMSPAARYMTGATLVVDGGTSIL